MLKLDQLSYEERSREHFGLPNITASVIILMGPQVKVCVHTNKNEQHCSYGGCSLTQRGSWSFPQEINEEMDLNENKRSVSFWFTSFHCPTVFVQSWPHAPDGMLKSI